MTWLAVPPSTTQPWRLTIRNDDGSYREPTAEEVAALLAAESQLSAALAEVGRLREFIAASEECAKANDLLAIYEENERYRTAFQQVIDRVQSGNHTVSAAHCSWCSERWPKLDGETAEVARDYARKHAFSCTQHPLRIERDEAIKQRDSARAECAQLDALLVGALGVIEDWPDCDQKAQHTNTIVELGDWFVQRCKPSEETLQPFRDALSKEGGQGDE